MLRFYLMLVITSSDLRNYDSLLIKIKRIACRHTNDLSIQILNQQCASMDMLFKRDIL
jgi:hypothetical protein